ncbi:MAG: hypothetical protein Tsb0014_21870 [Pleurocapsa sp.]
MNNQNIFLFPTDLSENTELSLTYLLEQSTILVKDVLQEFANESDFTDKMQLAFGDNTDGSQFKSSWQVGEFVFPQIEVVATSGINGANGAYAQRTNKIYLAQEFLLANQQDIDLVAAVLLEEYGHYVDSEINPVDSPGDEGAIFSALVRGEELTESELQQLKNEDDSAVVILDGESVKIEANQVQLEVVSSKPNPVKNEGVATGYIDIDSRGIQISTKDVSRNFFVNHVDLAGVRGITIEKAGEIVNNSIISDPTHQDQERIDFAREVFRRYNISDSIEYEIQDNETNAPFYLIELNGSAGGSYNDFPGYISTFFTTDHVITELHEPNEFKFSASLNVNNQKTELIDFTETSANYRSTGDRKVTTGISTWHYSPDMGTGRRFNEDFRTNFVLPADESFTIDVSASEYLIGSWFKPNRLDASANISLNTIPLQYVVNTTGDESDPNPNDGIPDVDLEKEGLQTTLRSLIEFVESNGSSFDDKFITFDIPTDDPGYNSDTGTYTIQINQALPSLKGNVTIEGLDIIELKGNQGNFDGIEIEGNNNTIRGLNINNFGGDGIQISGDFNVIENNTISGNQKNGINIINVDNTVIKNNKIGTDVSGTNALGNQEHGIYLNGSASNEITDNLISANKKDGINFSFGSNTLIQGNKIGTDISGKLNLGNEERGIYIQSSNNTIGNTRNFISGDAGNIIAFNQGKNDNEGGIVIANEVIGVSILGNSVFENQGIGIDLGEDGTTINDELGDFDTGANQKQNYPTISLNEDADGNTKLEGKLDSIANNNYIVELFLDNQPIGTTIVITDEEGKATFDISENPNFSELSANSSILNRLTATATDSDNNTSEFLPIQNITFIDKVSRVREGDSTVVRLKREGATDIETTVEVYLDNPFVNIDEPDKSEKTKLYTAVFLQGLLNGLNNGQNPSVTKPGSLLGLLTGIISGEITVSNRIFQDSVADDLDFLNITQDDGFPQSEIPIEVTFAPGQTETTLKIETFDDSSVECTHATFLEIPNQDRSFFIIHDNDEPDISFWAKEIFLSTKDAAVGVGIGILSGIAASVITGGAALPTLPAFAWTVGLAAATSASNRLFGKMLACANSSEGIESFAESLEGILPTSNSNQSNSDSSNNSSLSLTSKTTQSASLTAENSSSSSTGLSLLSSASTSSLSLNSNSAEIELPVNFVPTIKNSNGDFVVKTDDNRLFLVTDFVSEEQPFSSQQIELDQVADINNNGQAVGFNVSNEETIAAIWDNGTVTPISINNQSAATAINDAGQIIINSVNDEGLAQAYLYELENNNFVSITNLDSETSTENGAYVVDINNNGDVLGYGLTPEGNLEAFIWKDNSLEFLGTLGGVLSIPIAINDAGDVIGISETSTSEQLTGFIYKDGTINNLDAGQGFITLPQAFNENGEVVGIYAGISQVEE